MPEKVFDRRTDGSVFDFRAVFSSFESTTELEAPPNQDVSSGRGSGGATGGSRVISTALVDASSGNDISLFEGLPRGLFAGRRRCWQQRREMSRATNNTPMGITVAKIIVFVFEFFCETASSPVREGVAAVAVGEAKAVAEEDGCLFAFIILSEND